MRILILLLVLPLAGCLTTMADAPACKALIGPIKYNSANKDSRRHAGPDLAVDLKARNQVGSGLGCPEYR